MSREIKFRAWDGKQMDRRWKDGRLVIDASTGEAQKVSYGSTPFNVSIPHGLAIMQYTGLKDKNGVEIYEGDVVTIPSRVAYDKRHIKAEVVYESGSYVLRLEPNERDGVLWSLSRLADNSEVIGNIYENPELLNQEDE